MKHLIILILALAWSTGLLAGPTLQPCHVDGVTTEVSCGSIRVPRGDGPDTGHLELALTVVHASPGRRSDDAVLVLAGGPGQDARRFAGALAVSLSVNRDLVFVDQRGTGGSEPLRCPSPLGSLHLDPAGWARACLAALPDDLENFSHAAAIEDFEAVRVALGYTQWNLFGGSMGTRVAQLYMRRHPDSVRSAVLDGVAPLGMVVGATMGRDAQPTLDAVFERCAAQPDCSAAFPDAAGRFAALLDALAVEPVRVRFPHPATGERIERTLDRDGLALLVRGFLYSTSVQRILPLLLDHAADGDFGPLLALQESFTETYGDMMSFGLTANILCSEDIGRHGAAAIPAEEADSFVGRAQAEFWLTVCAEWPRYTIAADHGRPLESGIPTFIVSGELDPVTPPRYGDMLAATLTNARHVVVPGGDHTVAFHGGPCISRVIDQFIDHADPAAVDATCIGRLGPAALFSRPAGFVAEEAR